MENLDYTWINSSEELNEMIELGYTMGISVCNNTDGKYLVCDKENYKKVFEEVTGHEDDNQGTFGTCFPLDDTEFVNSLFDN